MFLVTWLKSGWKRFGGYLPLTMVIVLMAVLATPAWAGYSYYVPISVFNNSTTAYSNLPILVSINNTQLYTQGYINATALDTDVQEGAGIPYSVASNKLGLYAASLTGNQERDYTYYLDYTPEQGDYPLIVGVGGDVTRADTPALELGNNFTIEQKGYVDTSAGSNKNSVYKESAFKTYISAAETITSEIFPSAIYPMTPVECTPAAGAWNDVDANNYGVPDGASGILFHVVSTAFNYGFGVRKNLSTDARNGDIYQGTHYWGMIGIDANGIFDCWVEHATNTDVYIVGYTMSGVTYNLNAQNISIGVIGAWTDIDCTAWAPGAKAIIVEIVNVDAAAAKNGGVRPNDSSSEVTYGLFLGAAANGHVWQIVGCDAGEVIEGKIDDTDVDFYGIGYITSGVTMLTDPMDKSLAGVGAWTDISCPAGSSLAIFSVTASQNFNYGFRKNGSAENILQQTFYIGAPFALVGCDAGSIVEGQIANVAMDFWLWGYANTVAKSVSATGITSGVRKVVTTAAVGGNLTISVYDQNDAFIDDDTVALAGASVPNNDNTWYFDQNTVMPYMDYQKFTTASGFQLWYQPVTIVNGTTATDRSGAGNHGTINWGTNPAGIEVTVAGVTSATAYTASAEEGELPDVLPIPTGFDVTATNVTGVATLWQYDLINRAATSLGWTAQTMYVIVGLLAATGIGFGALIGTGTMLGFAIGFGATAGLFASTGVMPWWTIILTIAVIGMGIYTWRRG